MSAQTIYQVNGGSVAAHSTDPGLVIETSVLPLPGPFSLIDGESFTFSFFNIWTDETTINKDDRVSYGISATLNFSQPTPGGSTSITGLTFGGSIFFGLLQWGEVVWGGNQDLTIGDTTFRVSLSNEIFNLGLGGLSNHGASVRATVTQLSSGGYGTTSVPDEPATAALFVLGLLCLVVGRWPSKRT